MNPPRNHVRRRDGGFTLLELLIAIAMMAIVTVSLYAAMTSAFRSRAAARRQVDGVAGAMIALDVIGQDLQSVVAPSPTSEDGTTPLLAGPFVGTAKNGPTGPAGRVNFFALGRDGLGPAAAASGGSNGLSGANGLTTADPLSDGVRQIELALDTQATPPLLMRRIRRNLLDDSTLDVQDEPLLSGVRGFGLRYYDGSGWQEQWDSVAQGDVLPFAVEITLELDQPSPTDPSRFYRVTQILPLSGATLPAADATLPQ